jgi:RNA polymerase sigma-70 factor (ECF subfamily)
MDMRQADNLGLAVHCGLEGSLEQMIRAYQDQIYAYALRLLRNSFDAQEVTQDVFVGAHRALTLKYDEERCRRLELRPWLFRIMRNLALNRLRARRAVQEEPFSAALREPAVFSGTRAGCGFGNPPDLEELESAQARLKPAARELIVLRFMEGLSYAEIAKVLGTTEASARGKVFRALQRLKLLLREPKVALK